jgi:hypothetical protein
MTTSVIHSAEFNEGYQIDSTPDGLEISTTSYHARPLRLNREQLAGLWLGSGSHSPSINVTVAM